MQWHCSSPKRVSKTPDPGKAIFKRRWTNASPIPGSGFVPTVLPQLMGMCPDLFLGPDFLFSFYFNTVDEPYYKDQVISEL